MSLDGARVPPQNLAAERSVLGCLILDNSTIPEAAEMLRPECFYAIQHGVMFSAILAMQAAGTVADAITLTEELERRGELSDCGGASYLLEIMETVPHTAHLRDYCKIVHARWLQRQTIAALTDRMRDCYAGEIPVEEVLGKAEADIRLLSDGVNAGSLVKVEDSLHETLDLLMAGSKHYVKTGISAVDEAIYGMGPGQLIVLAGRPSMGKSALMLNIAQNVAERGESVFISSLEMTRHEINERMISRVCGLSVRDMRAMAEAGKCSQISDAANLIWKLPAYVDDLSHRLSDILTAIRVSFRKHGCKVAFVDYLQKITPPDTRHNRDTQIGECTGALKQLAKELKIPIVILAQLNRGVENREDKRPRLMDLRESGSIEQDADAVMFTHRESYYRTDSDPNEAELVCAKQRGGTLGIVKLRWDGRTTTFRDPVMAVSDTEYESWV